MKKLAFITLVFIASIAQAQHKMQSEQKMQAYSAEEASQLKVKQLTLDLDLSEAQQQQVEALYLENAKTREAKMKQRNLSENSKTSKMELSKEDKLQMKNDRLDHQIEMKKKMKEILNNDQYTKWEKMREEKKESYKKKQMHQKRKAKLTEQKE
ncbi:MAG: hypothetical protein ABI295_01735 [Xanthomarina sp.]